MFIPCSDTYFWKLLHMSFVYNLLVAIGGWPLAGHFTLVNHHTVEMNVLTDKDFHSCH